MHYVYLLKSISSNKTYIGYTINLQQRLDQHNFGTSRYTSEDRPWQLVMYLCFDDKMRALDFEKYLKSGSGYAFAKRRLW
jgi:putative endonuclease